VKQNFFQKDLKTSTSEKKKKKERKKRREKRERAQFVINFHEPNNSNIFYFCS